MLAAEGQVHKRQRRVATPAFSIQNLRALVPHVFGKGVAMRDKWLSMLKKGNVGEKGMKVDACDWMSRATFDVIGYAGEWCVFHVVTYMAELAQASTTSSTLLITERTSSSGLTRTCLRSESLSRKAVGR